MDPGPVARRAPRLQAPLRQGLIYRGERLISWCPRCQTALSDLEVDHEEVAGSPLAPRLPDRGQRRESSTSRRPGRRRCSATPAVAVHPDDDALRASDRQARSILPILDRLIPIVADDAVDPAFGTGAVKVTPAHDPNDFEIGQRHGLPAVNVMNLDGTMNAERRAVRRA